MIVINAESQLTRDALVRAPTVRQYLREESCYHMPLKQLPLE